MIGKYGRDDVLGGIEAIMDQSEAVARERVRAMPDGVYEAESFMDDDGVALGKRMPIRVKVEVAGDQMTVDLTGRVEAGRGLLQLRRDRGPLLLPGRVQVPDLGARSADQRRPVPRARHRAAAGPRGQRAEARGDADVDDLSDDHRRHDLQGAGAGACRTTSSPVITPISCVGRVNGRRPKDDSFYIYLGGLIGGGWGAKHNSDGVNATIAMNDGDTHNGPSEQVEAKYPLLVERYALRPDSGGAGQFRGGLGTEQVVQARQDPLQRADGSRALPAVGAVRRPVRLRQRGRHPSLRRGRAALPQRQGAQPGAAAGRRLHPALRRRRRFRLAARARAGKLERDVRYGYVTKDCGREASTASSSATARSTSIWCARKSGAKKCAGKACRSTILKRPTRRARAGRSISTAAVRRRSQAQRRRAAGHRHDRAVLLAPPPGAAGFAISGS